MRIAKTDARKRFAEVVTRAGYRGERVKVTHYGRELVAIVSQSDLEKLEDCEREGGPAGRTRKHGTPRRNRRRRRSKT